MPCKRANLAKSPDALREIDAFFPKSARVIGALTVPEILDGQLPKKPP